MGVCGAILMVYSLTTWPLTILLCWLIGLFVYLHNVIVQRPPEECPYGCQEEIKRLRARHDTSNAQVLELHGQLNRKSYDLDESRHYVSQLSNRIQSLQASVDQALADKDDALMRLSEIMSYRLRDNNPRVADLSDQNRPTKLADQYSEVYDNEWTSAFAYLEEDVGISEENTIQILLDVVMHSFIFCRNLTTKTWELVSQHIFWDLDESLQQDVRRWLKHTRKENSLSMLPKVQKDYMEYLKGTRTDIHKHLSNQALETYIHACARLCWLMAVQDPPVVVECPGWQYIKQQEADEEHVTDDAKENQTHETPTASTSVQSPDVEMGPKQDHERNQAFDTDLSAGTEPSRDTAAATNVVEEVEQAIPPSLNVTTTTETPTATPPTTVAEVDEGVLNAAVRTVDKISFDRNSFKDYTRRGKYIDFVVWPKLLLHEDGPLLCKGVAQGCNRP